MVCKIIHVALRYNFLSDTARWFSFRADLVVLGVALLTIYKVAFLFFLLGYFLITELFFALSYSITVGLYL